jgi:DNA-binding NtrC family response regulator
MAGARKDLGEEIRDERLLEELYRHFSTLEIRVPPLRECLADLPDLAASILERLQTPALPRPRALSQGAWDILRAYHWPGNLSEFIAVLSGASAHAAGSQIEVSDLPLYLRLGPAQGPPTAQSLPLDTLLGQVERRLIQLALQKCGGNKSQAAEMLAIWRPRLLRRMEGLGIPEDHTDRKLTES